MASKAHDLTGQRFYRLVAVRREGSHKSGEALWVCRCDCGSEKIFRSSFLKSGRARGCGCLAKGPLTYGIKSHGLHRSGEYGVWAGMKQRCGNPKHAAYYAYGARGIMVCARWANSFEAFYADMGPRPEGMTIERVDVNRGYEPGNCKWADLEEQSRNKRTNRLIEHEGISLCVKDWGKRVGINGDTIRARLRLGWDVGLALTTPVRQTKKGEGWR